MKVLSEKYRPIAKTIMDGAKAMLKTGQFGGYTTNSVAKALSYGATKAVEAGDTFMKTSPFAQKEAEFQIYHSTLIAKSILKRRIFGGFTKESVENAIKIVVIDPLLEAQKALRSKKL